MALDKPVDAGKGENAMKTIYIFENTVCCSEETDGNDVDQALLEIEADVEWAKRTGAQVERFNLSQQAAAFRENLVVKEFIERSGQDALPLTLVNGEIALVGRYPQRIELARWIGVNA